MEKFSGEVDYIDVNEVEPGKVYRIDFGNGTALEGEISSIKYQTYDYAMNIEIRTASVVDEPVPLSSLESITIQVPYVGIVTTSCENFERLSFKQRICIESYTLKYEGLEEIVKEHYAKEGLEVIGVEFDSRRVYLSFKK